MWTIHCLPKVFPIDRKGSLVSQKILEALSIARRTLLGSNAQDRESVRRVIELLTRMSHLRINDCAFEGVNENLDLFSQIGQMLAGFSTVTGRTKRRVVRWYFTDMLEQMLVETEMNTARMLQAYWRRRWTKVLRTSIAVPPLEATECTLENLSAYRFDIIYIPPADCFPILTQESDLSGSRPAIQALPLQSGWIGIDQARGIGLPSDQATSSLDPLWSKVRGGMDLDDGSFPHRLIDTRLVAHFLKSATTMIGFPVTVLSAEEWLVACQGFNQRSLSSHPLMAGWERVSRVGEWCRNQLTQPVSDLSPISAIGHFEDGSHSGVIRPAPVAVHKRCYIRAMVRL